MSKKRVYDSKYDSVQSMLKAAGKTMFIAFYYDLKDFSLSDKYLCEKVYRESPTAKSPNQRYKVPRAREIFKTNQQIEALRIVINSNKLSVEIIDKAKKILQEEMKLAEINEDTRFANEFNAEFPEKDDTPFEYDNTPEKPREKSAVSAYAYPRSKKVANNALKHAHYLCEVDASHMVFTRKNSDINYTEPHHIVPLSAQKDFPEANLDREQNVVSLCSHCHNLLHYGADIDPVLLPVYTERKELVGGRGANESFDFLQHLQHKLV